MKSIEDAGCFLEESAEEAGGCAFSEKPGGGNFGGVGILSGALESGGWASSEKLGGGNPGGVGILSGAVEDFLK